MTPRCGQLRAGATILELLIAISIISLLISLAVPAVQSAREAGRRAQCSNNLHQVALGLLAFESRQGALPAGISVRVAGPVAKQPRVWITTYLLETLPFLEGTNAGVDLREDFAAPVHAQIIAQSLPVMRCPSAPSRDARIEARFSITDGVDDLSMVEGNPLLEQVAEALAGYGDQSFVGSPGDYGPAVGVSRTLAGALGYFESQDRAPGEPNVGLEGAFPLPIRPHQLAPPLLVRLLTSSVPVDFAIRRRLATVTDGASQTIAMIEDAGRPQFWAGGYRDVTREPVEGAAWVDPRAGVVLSGSAERSLIGLRNSGRPYSFHPAGVTVAFLDGHVSTISSDVDARALVAMVTPDKNDQVP